MAIWPASLTERELTLTIHLPIFAHGSKPTTAILDLIERSLRPDSIAEITFGLPSGARLLVEQQLAVAGTVCTVPLFREAMHRVSRQQNVDVILARHDTYPELLSAVVWDAAVRVAGEVMMLTNLVLFSQGVDDYWLVPSEAGPSLRIGRDGLHLSCEPPFSTWDERCTGVCEAAKQIVRATRPGLGR